MSAASFGGKLGTDHAGVNQVADVTVTEATGFEAKTIHRLLEVDPRSGGFKRGEDNPLDCDLRACRT